jgi:periplasmic protein CpxP/Spy
MKKILLICCLFIGFTAAGFTQGSHPVVADPAVKAKGLQKELNLSDHQTAKIAAIYQESVNKFDKIKIAEHGNTNKMLADIGPLRTATIKKIKAILTPRQAVKYDKLLKETSSQSVNGGWSDGWS